MEPPKTDALDMFLEHKEFCPDPASPCNCGYVAARGRLLELNNESARINTTLSSLMDWTIQFGAELCPQSGVADTYGNGVRACKDRVSRILIATTETPKKNRCSDG
jgi:hypothetical protein